MSDEDVLLVFQTEFEKTKLQLLTSRSQQHRDMLRSLRPSDEKQRDSTTRVVVLRQIAYPVPIMYAPVSHTRRPVYSNQEYDYNGRPRSPLSQ